MFSGGMSDEALLRAPGIVGRPTATPTATPTPTPTATGKPTPTPTATGKPLSARERNLQTLREQGGETGLDYLDPNKTAGAHPTVAPGSKEEAAAFLASGPMRQALRGAGWGIPGRPSGAVTTLEGLDMSNARKLKSFDYALTPEEWEMARGAYTGIEGYTPGKDLSADQLPRIRSGVTRSAPMTWEAYNALTDAQRAAVDFNGLLVQARERDIGRQNPSMMAGDYTAVRDRVFGAGGGSDAIGSDTLNLLDKMGLVAQGQDLDEFLSLDRAITLDELKDFTFAEGEPIGLEHEKGSASNAGPMQRREGRNNFAQARGLENLSKLDTVAIQRAGEFISGALKVQEGAPWDRDTAISVALGAGRPTPDKIPFGWALGPEERATDEDLNKEKFFQESYQYLQNKGNADTGWIWEGMKTFNFDDADKQELFNYFDQRSRWEESTGTLDPNLRTGAELRQFAGIGG
jgi:hypothetical protein